MNNALYNTEDILSQSISGFHQYVLTDPVHLSYVSENLCRMTGYSEDMLISDEEDLYLQMVHPGDRKRYNEFLCSLHSPGQTQTARYRIVTKSGSILYVNDTAVSRCLEDGTVVAESVLSDITELKNENQNLNFLNETMPCGFIKYTCEKTPRVTYINERMLQILRFPKEQALCRESLELYSQNIFMMIPAEERRKFGVYLNNVYQTNGPIAGEMTVLRHDGTKAHLFGWVVKCVNDDGTEEFQSACIDMSRRQQYKAEQERNRYIRALAKVYDKIFEYNLTEHTVKCLHSGDSPAFRYIENISMQMEEATEKWIADTAQEEDRDAIRSFFAAFYHRALTEQNGPPMIRYRARSTSGAIKTYTGIFLKIDDSVSLFCCHREQESEETATLRDENMALKSINSNMQKIVMKLTEGMAAFEILGDTVTPLYVSDNICRFFGFEREEWMQTMRRRTSIREFVSRCKVDYSDFKKLLETGEAEFSYFDFRQNRERRIKAVCSQKTPEQDCRRYVMLYNMDDKAADSSQSTRVRIRTFGYFDVFVNDRPIAFRNEKSRELFALLTDRRGGFVSSEEAIAYLWEDEPANSVTLARYRKVALRLKNLLQEYGISDIVESVNGKRRLVTEKVECDLYDYLSGREEFAQLFKGSYLSNYSWAEPTLAELTGDHLYRNEE